MQSYELENLLKTKSDYISWEEYGRDKLAGKYELPPTEPRTATVKIVDANDHVEGNWHTDLYVILSVATSEGVQYFKKTGYYTSHDGEYWDGPLVEVKPKEKTVTVWQTDDEVKYDDNSYNSF